MAKLVGNWKLEKSDNFEEYMKAIGVGFALRKMGNLTKPSVHIAVDGDNWSLKTTSTVKNTEIAFQLSKEFEEKTADGRDMKTTCTIEGDSKLIQTQKGEVDSVLTRELEDDNIMVCICEAKGVVSKRTYSRIE